MGNIELSARVIVKDDVKGTSKKAMMAYFKTINGNSGCNEKALANVQCG